MKMVKVLLLLAGLTFAAMPAQARQAMGVHEKTVDGFMYLVDNSGSMMMNHTETGIQKIEMAKRIMTKIDSHIPELGYQGALALFAPNASVIPATAWDHETFVAKIQGISNDAPIYARLTPMTVSLKAAAGMVSELSGSKAVFLFSDGAENRGGSATAAAQALYAANPNMVLHIISLADSAKGAANLKAMADLNSNSICINGSTLLDSDRAALDFVSTTSYVETIPSQSVASMQEVLFHPGKYDVLPKYATILDQMAAVMVTRPELKIFVEGFADPSGDTGSNLILSENRAAAVKAYLVGAGVRADQIIDKGRGETETFPSYMLDRRVEVMIIWQ